MCHTVQKAEREQEVAEKTLHEQKAMFRGRQRSFRRRPACDRQHGNGCDAEAQEGEHEHGQRRNQRLRQCDIQADQRHRRRERQISGKSERHASGHRATIPAAGGATRLVRIMAALWTPSPERITAARITAFADWLRARRGLTFPDYESMWSWSVNDLEGFWSAVWQFFDVQASRPYEKVLADSR